jgi:hypothetical protein
MERSTSNESVYYSCKGSFKNKEQGAPLKSIVAQGSFVSQIPYVNSLMERKREEKLLNKQAGID